MATFNELYSKTTKSTSGGGVSFNDIFGLDDDEVEKRLQEQARQDRIAQTRQAAEEANAQVSKNTAKNQSTFQKIKRFGPEAVKDIPRKTVGVAKSVGEGLIQAPQILAQGTARALGAGEETQGLEPGRASLETGRQKIIQLLRDPNVPKERKELLMRVLGEETEETVRQATENTKTVESQTDKRRFLSAAAELGLTLAGGGTFKAAKTLGTTGRAALLGGEGAAFGALGALEQEEASLGSVAAGAGLGFGLGALLPVVGSRLKKGGTVADDFLPNKPGQGVEIPPITDRSRLLTATAGESGGTSSKFIQTIEQDPRLAVIGRGADINDVNRLNAIDKQIQTAQTTSNISPDEARNLLRERQAVVERIQNPQTPIAREIASVDERLAQATTKRERAGILQEKEFLQRQAIVEARNANVFDDLGGTQRVAGQAKTTEARAIENGLAEEFGDAATYGATTWAEQTQRAIDIANADYEAAKRIAKGLQEPPEGVLVNSVYKTVENRAVKEGDANLLRELAQAPTASRTSRAAQELGVLGARDPESPITAMKELAEARKTAGLSISQPISIEEAETITRLAKEVADARVAIASGGSRQAYGNARITYDNYIGGLTLDASKVPFRQMLKDPDFAKKVATKGFGLAKSAKATLDNSTLFRQGWPVLMTKPKTWAKSSLKSFEDMVKTYGGKEVLDHVHAEAVSNKNVLNGLAKAADLDVYGVKKGLIEEAFPVSFGKTGKLITRPFKASEVAFTAWQQRTRLELFDHYIDLAKRTGVDLADKREIQDIGKLVNSLTGRGKWGKYSGKSGFVNAAFFSPKLLKRNIDILTAHGALTPWNFQRRTFAQKQAARNLVKIAVGSAIALKLAEAATGGKAESDSRSSNFGKVQVGSTRFDLTGGMSSLVTLGSRLLDGNTKNSSTGEIKPLNDKSDPMSQSYWDVLLNFSENKLSPAAGTIVDWGKGEDFDGKKPTIGSTVKALTVPLIIEQYSELKDTPGSANILAAMIAEGLGISANSYGMTKDWNANNTKIIEAFKSKVDKNTFAQTNKEFDAKFTDWYGQVSQNDKFWSLPIEQRESLVTKKKNDLTKEVMESRGFTYKEPKRDKSSDKLKEELLRYGR